MAIDILQIFDYNIMKAKNLLELTKVYEIKQNIDKFINERPRVLSMELLVGVLDSIREFIRTPIENYMRLVNETCYEQAVVSAVTALETYLRDKYCEEKGIDEYVGRSFQNVDFIEEKFIESGVNIFSSVEEKNKLNHIFQIRHIIVHKAGIIDQKSCENANWNQKLIGKSIRRYLDYNAVKEIIESVETFVKDVEKRTIQGALI